ncbi:LolA family protein [Lichenicoccus sp.]|uniref:LolA family protein n=1 Tax=Lichenicoccus sp. TaxID=2781899 RepID=UPI003D0AA16A
MMRRLAVLLLVAGLSAPAASFAQAPIPAHLTPADRGRVERIQDTLDAITTLKAHFVQIAPDGATTQGTAWLDRPGRMRFQYNKPSPLLLVANHGTLVFNDSELRQTTTLPLDKTPLGLLLAPNVTLSGAVTLTAFRHADGQMQLTLVRTTTPGDGSLTLIFSDQPLALRSWSVIDAQGKQTQVMLSNVVLGGSFPQNLFDTDIGQAN